VLKQVQSLRPSNASLSHVTDIEEPGPLSHRQVLVDEAAVLHRHVPAGKIDHPRTALDVSFV
jgi:hypothetical protein